jgi:hypothetical protein
MITLLLLAVRLALQLAVVLLAGAAKTSAWLASIGSRAGHPRNFAIVLNAVASRLWGSCRFTGFSGILIAVILPFLAFGTMYLCKEAYTSQEFAFNSRVYGYYISISQAGHGGS